MGEIDGLKLRYSKIFADDGPIMSTKVNEGLPCAYPEQTTETSIYYPLESSNFIPKCDKLDTRYEILSSELQTD